jgi:hypothetical protein
VAANVGGISGEFLDSTGNSQLDATLVAELNLLATGFTVHPRFHVFDDGKAPNAFATPERTDTSPRFPDGTVVFGMTLMREEFSRSSGRGYAIPAIMAHEFGHILQYRLGVQMPTKMMELQADVLAGWYLAHRSDYAWTDVQEPLRSFFEKGDYQFNNPDHHGTPKERLSAIAFGLTLGRANIQQAFQESTRYITSQ